MITEDLVPQAIMSGMSYEDAWDSTPAELTVVISSWYKARTVSAWIDGQYVLSAIACAFSKNVKYPENPLDVLDNMVDPNMELTEEEAEYWRKKIMSGYGRLGSEDE